MKIIIRLIASVYLLLSFSNLTFSQPYHMSQYDRIPMKVQLWGSQYLDRELGTSQTDTIFKMIKQMGADVVFVQNVNGPGLDYTSYERLEAAGLKIMPYQDKDSLGIAQQTESYYTFWEAEGTPMGEGNASLTIDDDLATVTISDGRTCIVTYPGAPSGLILSGPGYQQNARTALGKDTISYTAQFHLKLNENPNYFEGYPDLERSDDVVCTLQVTASAIYQDTSEVWHIREYTKKLPTAS